MAVEYSGGTVKLSLDFQSAKNIIKEKLSKIICGIVLAGLIIATISWLIIISSELSRLKDENQTLRSDFKSLQTEHQNLKSKWQDLQNNSRSEQEVKQKLTRKLFYLSTVYSGEDLEYNLSKVSNDFTKYIKNEAYKRIGKYGHFYKLPPKQFSNQEWTFQEGKTACEKINGHILEFDETDPNIQDFFKAIVSEFGMFYSTVSWIGLTDIKQEGSFKWLRPYSKGQYHSKTPYSMAIWHRGEPNNLGTENCVQLIKFQSKKYEIWDVKCTKTAPIICQRNTVPASNYWK